MARISEKAICKESDINSLNAIVYGDYSSDIKRRAQCILYSAEGRTNKEVSELTGMSPNWTGIWIRRFNQEGIDGIQDRPRSGRKGGEAIPDLLDRIRDKLEDSPPDGDVSWKADSIAKALGVSTNSVRNTVRGTDISFDRKRTWDFNTNGELVAKYLDIVAFYCSKSEKAIVLSASQNRAAYGGNGSFTTRNRNLADELKQFSVKKADVVSLGEVLSIATEHTKDERRFSEGSLSRFLDDLINDLPQAPGMLYFVFLFCEGTAEQKLLHHAGIQFLNAASMEKWQEAVESFISLHCDSVTEIAGLKSALHRYLSSRTDRSEPFQWRKQLFLKSGNEAVGAPITFQGAEATEDAIQEPLTENASDSSNGGSKGSRIRITFEYFDEYNEKSSATVEVNDLKRTSECDTSSEDSILEFVSDLERCVIPAVDKGTQLLGEMAMQAVKRNSRCVSSQGNND